MSRQIYGVNIKNGTIILPPCKYTPPKEKDINLYIMRLNNVLIQLNTLKDPKIALQRLEFLESELDIILNPPSTTI
jgi:hypothetical protein